MASSSESSEAEDLEKFAVITDIVNSEVVKFNGSSHSSAKSKPSLRYWQEDEDIASSTTELITPEFRQHVAKKLSKFLDKNYICTQEVEHPQNGHANSSHESSGIRLLLKSSQRLKEESSSSVSKKKRINISSTSESDMDDEELNRLAEAAVSGYSIIRTGEEGHNGSREEVEDEAVKTNGVERKKEKKRKKQKRKKIKVDEEKKEKKHKKLKKEKYKEKT